MKISNAQLQTFLKDYKKDDKKLVELTALDLVKVKTLRNSLGKFRRKEWALEEDEIILDNVEKGSSYIAGLLNRSIDSVVIRASELLHPNFPEKLKQDQKVTYSNLSKVLTDSQIANLMCLDSVSELHREDAIIKPLNIIADSREKNPLFDVSEAIIQKLDTGDYSLQGHEDKISIENKATVSEIAGNFREKRFWHAIERLSKLDHKYIVFQFSRNDVAKFPHTERSGVPVPIRKKIRVRSRFLLSCIKTLETKYGINVVYADNPENAKKVIKDILMNYNENL